MKLNIITSFLFLSILYLTLNVGFAQTGASVLSPVVNYLLLEDSDTGELPPEPNFTVELPVHTSGPVYNVSYAQWNIQTGTDGNPENNSERMQAAINFAKDQGFKTISLPPGEVILGDPLGNPAYYYEGFRLPSDVTLLMDENTILRMRPNAAWNQCLIYVYLSGNVTIQGGQLIGDRKEHDYVPIVINVNPVTNHDEGHGICVTESSHVLIENTKISEFTGDGVFVIGTESRHVTIRNNEIFYNRRQGVSLVGPQLVKIEENHIHDIIGIPPQFGVDVEATPNQFGKDRDILIQRNVFEGNRGGDVTLQSGSNIFVLNNTMTESAEPDREWRGAGITFFNRAEGIIQGNVIRKAIIDNVQTTGNGIKELPVGEEQENRQLYIHDNVCMGCGLLLAGSKVGPDVRRNKFGGDLFWFIDVENLTLIDNNQMGMSSTNCFNVKFQRTTGYARDNTFNNEPIEYPLSQSIEYNSPGNSAIPGSTSCPFVDIGD